MTSTKRGLLHRKSKHTWRDWSGVEALIGHDVSLPARARLGGLRRLRPAQLADLIEEASDQEQKELLSRIHAHPELEADVFEELDEDEAGDLLEARTDTQVADVLSHMRSDDAAGALLDLPQERRKPVLDLLPDENRRLVGAVGLVTLLQSDPQTTMQVLAYPERLRPPRRWPD